ncbi:class I SAM-dependent methyltransferase [bacterium]|nr:class I SAM-dependent methyltransferase [bacterium]MCI0566106.1 class I SAM-dependent methyltransferase [bacterium]
MEEKKQKLNVGCGESKKDGYINLDFSELVKPDVKHDLNRFPYPFKDDTFDIIEVFHVLEHLDRPFDCMREFHRIMKHGGTLHVKVPHFSRGFTHAEHAHGFDVTFPLYFNPEFTKSGYFGVHFELISSELHWFAFPHLLRFMGFGTLASRLIQGASAVISFLGNISPAFASRIWCFWVGGFDEIEFKFKCIKR